jgi:ParB family chromosome partitioning protein
LPISRTARKDVSDLERARNYAAAKDHYGNHMTRMAERLKLSKGWLSKMLRVAALPEAVIAAFAGPGDIQLKPAMPLPRLLTTAASPAILSARPCPRTGSRTSGAGTSPVAASDVLRRLLAAPHAGVETRRPAVVCGTPPAPGVGRCCLRPSGLTLRLHSGTGSTTEDLLEGVRALRTLAAQGKGVQV